MSMSGRQQLTAFLALVAAVVLVALAPILTSGIIDKALPDSLIAMSDKAVVGIVGILGTIAGLMFRTNRLDDARAETTGKAFDAITATAQSSQGGQQP